MRQLEAFEETLKIVSKHVYLYPLCAIGLDETMQLPHLQSMYDRIVAAPDEFDEAKLGRWLGWAQASAVAMSAMTLEGCKALNKKWSTD
jgi:hypothetical protein